MLWTYPDGSHLFKRDAKRLAKSPKATSPIAGVTTLYIASFSRGSWRNFERRLRLGFEHVREHRGPLVINLRGNPGGQSYQSIPRTVGLCTTKVRLSLALSPALPCIAAHTGGHRRARGERGDARGCCLAAGARAPAALWSTNLEAGGRHGMSAAWCAARQLR